MKKILPFVGLVIILTGIVILWPSSDVVSHEIAQSNNAQNVQIVSEPSNVAQTNLHFENLHVTPEVR